MFAETYKLANQDICNFKDANQQSYNMYKQHCSEAILKKLATLPECETFEEDMYGFGLANMLQQACHKKWEGEKKHMIHAYVKATPGHQSKITEQVI